MRFGAECPCEDGPVAASLYQLADGVQWKPFRSLLETESSSAGYRTGQLEHSEQWVGSAWRSAQAKGEGPEGLDPLGGKSAWARNCGARWAKACIHAGLRVVHLCDRSWLVQQEERHA